jgi:hypothetical protein
MSYGSITSIPKIRLRIHQGHSSDWKSTENTDQKFLVSTVWSTAGIHNLLVLSAVMRYNAQSFCASVLSDIESNLCDSKRRKTLGGFYLYIDNAPAHNAKRSRQEITRTKTTGVVHPTCSPDAAPSDFFLFDYLKVQIAGFTANSPTDILSEIRRIFQKISKETLVVVYDE